MKHVNNYFLHVLSVLHSRVREVAKKLLRPKDVTKAQHDHVKAYPICAACGAAKGLQGHHKKPYHLFPELASDPKNFITLCEFVGGPECHLHLGHGGNFTHWNPNVEKDAADYLKADEPERAKIVARAKANALQ